MNRKYGVGIILLSALFLSFISFGAYREYSKESVDEQMENVSIESSTFDKEGYYLLETNGYVVVYESDRHTPYEYTDIVFEELPEILKQEIKNGKYIKNEEELYGFLENYTS